MADTLNGYTLLKDWTFCANGDFTTCEKSGTTYFLKRLPTPKYPIRESDYEPRTYVRLVEMCMKFEKRKIVLTDDLIEAAEECPAIVNPYKFFRASATYYILSRYVQDKQIAVEDVHLLKYDVKLSLIKSFADGLVALQKKKIVHGDLKPGNVFVCQNEDGKVFLNILDFDDSYYSEHPPTCEGTVGSMEYYSPELGDYICSEDPDRGYIVTCVSDIFAAGLMIHEYLTGEKVTNKNGKYPFQAKKDSDLKLSGSVPANMRDLLKSMLKIDRSERIDAMEFQRYVEDIINGVEHTPIPSGKPRLVKNPDGTFQYISSDRHSSSKVSRKMALEIASDKGIPLEGDDAGTDATGKGPIEEGTAVLSRTDRTITIKTKGGITTIPISVYEQMKKEGRL